MNDNTVTRSDRILMAQCNKILGEHGVQSTEDEDVMVYDNDKVVIVRAAGNMFSRYQISIIKDDQVQLVFSSVPNIGIDIRRHGMWVDHVKELAGEVDQDLSFAPIDDRAVFPELVRKVTPLSERKITY